MSKIPKTRSTPELVRVLMEHPNRCFEVGLLLDHGGCSVHWLNYNNKTQKLWDKGCDDEERTITVDEFLQQYSHPNIFWQIEYPKL